MLKLKKLAYYVALSCLLRAQSYASNKAPNLRSDLCTRALSAPNIGLDFQKILFEKVSLLKGTKAPRILIIGAGVGDETLLVSNYGNGNELSDLRIDSLEVRSDMNMLARALFERSNTDTSNINLLTRDASSQASYKDLESTYDIVLIRHPYIEVNKTKWLRIFEQALLRTKRKSGTLIISTFNETEKKSIVYAIKSSIHFPQINLHHQTDTKVSDIFGSDREILQITWKE